MCQAGATFRRLYGWAKLRGRPRLPVAACAPKAHACHARAGGRPGQDARMPARRKRGPAPVHAGGWVPAQAGTTPGRAWVTLAQAGVPGVLRR